MTELREISEVQLNELRGAALMYARALVKHHAIRLMIRRLPETEGLGTRLALGDALQRAARAQQAGYVGLIETAEDVAARILPVEGEQK